MTVLDLRPEWIVTPGDKTICRRVESARAKEAASNANIRRTRAARERFEAAMAVVA